MAVGEANFGGLILNYDEWTTTRYDVQRDYSEVTARVVLRVLWLVVATGRNEKKAEAAASSSENWVTKNVMQQQCVRIIRSAGG